MQKTLETASAQAITTLISDVTPDDADRIMAILHATNSRDVIDMSDAARERERDCYHSPHLYDLQSTAINAVLGACGREYLYDGHDCVEHHSSADGEPLAMYLNVGDTYSHTIVRLEQSGTWHVASLDELIDYLTHS